MSEEKKMNLEGRLKSEYSRLELDAIVSIEEYNHLQEDVLRWKANCERSWELRDEELQKYEATIEALTADVEMWKQRCLEAPANDGELEKLQADLKYANEKYEAILGDYDHVFSEIERERGELKLQNNLYFQMLNRLLKTIAEMEDKDE